MAKIAIMGFGTVGSGVLEVCRRNAASIARRAGEPVEVKYILDVRDFSDSPDAALFVKDINVILNDPEVKVVVETIGGTRFAYPYVRQCLESGRSVCTSNKEMVATYGAELLALAREHKAAFLFEASVGGGTPIITPMHQCLAANQISQIQGIQAPHFRAISSIAFHHLLDETKVNGRVVRSVVDREYGRIDWNDPEINQDPDFLQKFVRQLGKQLSASCS